jgi:hypothetical protein
VVLDLQEFLVEREELAGIEFALREQLLLGVGEDFFPMSQSVKRDGHW